MVDEMAVDEIVERLWDSFGHGGSRAQRMNRSPFRSRSAIRREVLKYPLQQMREHAGADDFHMFACFVLEFSFKERFCWFGE